MSVNASSLHRTRLLAYWRIKALRALATAGAAVALLTAAPAIASANTGATIGGSTLCNTTLVANVGNQVSIAGSGLAGLLVRINVVTGLVGVHGDLGVLLRASLLCPRH